MFRNGLSKFESEFFKSLHTVWIIPEATTELVIVSSRSRYNDSLKVYNESMIHTVWSDLKNSLPIAIMFTLSKGT